MREIAELRRVELLGAVVLALVEGLAEKVGEGAVHVEVETRRGSLAKLGVLRRHRQLYLPPVGKVGGRRLACTGARRVKRNHAADELFVVLAVEEKARGLHHVALFVDGMEMHRYRSRLAAGKRHRKNRPVAHRPRHVVDEPKPAAERVGKKGMAYDRLRHLSLGKAGDRDFVGVEERKLKPAVCQDRIALVGLERVCRLSKTPLEKLKRKIARHVLRETFVDQAVHRLRRRRELAGALVAFVKGERREDRGENLAKAALSELHLHKLEDRAQRMLRLRRNVVDLRGDELLLSVVEVDESRRELRVVDLQLRLEPAPDVAAAHERGKDGIG